MTDSRTSNQNFREALVQIRERAFRIAKINCPDTCSEWTHPLCWVARTADAALRATTEPPADLKKMADDLRQYALSNCNYGRSPLSKLLHSAAYVVERASQPPGVTPRTYYTPVLVTAESYAALSSQQNLSAWIAVHRRSEVEDGTPLTKAGE